MSQRGFSLLEVLLALSLLGIVTVVVVPVFFAYAEANTRNEVRSGAVAAAQQIMEDLREQDPSALPSSGSSPIQLVDIDGREFEGVIRYCAASSFCDAESRHLLVEVSFGGELVFSVESVFTR